MTMQPTFRMVLTSISANSCSEGMTSAQNKYPVWQAITWAKLPREDDNTTRTYRHIFRSLYHQPQQGGQRMVMRIEEIPMLEIQTMSLGSTEGWSILFAIPPTSDPLEQVSLGESSRWNVQG